MASCLEDGELLVHESCSQVNRVLTALSYPPPQNAVPWPTVMKWGPWVRSAATPQMPFTAGRELGSIFSFMLVFPLGFLYTCHSSVSKLPSRGRVPSGRCKHPQTPSHQVGRLGEVGRRLELLNKTLLFPVLPGSRFPRPPIPKAFCSSAGQSAAPLAWPPTFSRPPLHHRSALGGAGCILPRGTFPKAFESASVTTGMRSTVLHSLRGADGFAQHGL